MTPTLPALFKASLSACALIGLAACGGGDKTDADKESATPAAPEAPAADAPEPDTDATDIDTTAPISNPAAHVHGEAELSITREGNQFTAELYAPLANFGVEEIEADADALSTAIAASLATNGTPAIDAYAAQIVWPEAAGCALDGGSEIYGFEGEHGHATLTATYTCSAPDEADRVLVNLPGLPGFETIETVALVDGAQIAADLTSDNRAIDLK